MPSNLDVKAVLQALAKVAKDKDVEKIKELLAQETPDVSSEWLLLQAAVLGQALLVKQLLEAGVPVDALAKYKWLHLFKESVAKLLLEAGIDKDADTGHWLCTAAYCGSPKMVQLLVEHGARLDLRDHQGRTPLLRAAEEGRTEVVRILLEAGADANDRESGKPVCKTVLMHAAKQGKGDMVRLLLKAGAEVDAETSGGACFTALAEAVCGKGPSRVDAVRALIEAGANVNHHGGAWTAPRILLWACWREDGDPAILNALIDAGAEVSSNFGNFGTPLHEAARQNRPDLVQVLLEAGADLQARVPGLPGKEDEQKGMTPLEVAKHKKSRKVIPLLEAALQGEKPVPVAKPGKATAVAATWKRIKAWIKRSGADIKPCKGTTDRKLQELEKKLGVVLPDDFKESYRLHNGAEGGDSLVPLPDEPGIGYDLLAVDGILSEWQSWKGLKDSGDLDTREADPDEGIEAVWWHPAWIPFASLGNGDSLCIDLAPTGKGTRGQVITMNHETGRRDRLAPSFAHWLAERAEELEHQED